MGISNLFGLLQSVGAEPSQEIKVVATKQPSVKESDAPVRALGNRDARDEAEQWMKGVRKKGGGLRDILGTLGDALLIGSGGQAIYKPVRDKELLSSAFAGMSSEDPNALDMTLERLAQVRPDLVPQFYNYIADNKAKTATTAAATAKTADEKMREYIKLFGQVAGATNAQNASVNLPILAKIKTLGGLPDEYIIPEKYEGNESVLSGYRQGATPAQTQYREEHQDARFTQGEKGKDRRVQMQQAGADRRDNPPAPVKPSRQQEAEELYRRGKAGDKE
ncbi:MAG TPA: hypothetical protein VFK94_06760, partial [Patescibacteria group bacterium]|nr:hypothetical protein [Patescibacteria group bacterium]